MHPQFYAKMGNKILQPMICINSIKNYFFKRGFFSSCLLGTNDLKQLFGKIMLPLPTLAQSSLICVTKVPQMAHTQNGNYHCSACIYTSTEMEQHVFCY